MTAIAAAEEMISTIQVTEANCDALKFVGSTPNSGKMQLQLLLLEGLKTEDYVLEIGCGALVASVPIMSFLEESHFVGIAQSMAPGRFAEDQRKWRNCKPKTTLFYCKL